MPNLRFLAVLLPALFLLLGTGVMGVGQPAMAGPPPALFHLPAGITFGPNNRLYVANQGNHTVTVLSAGGRVVATWHVRPRDGRLSYFPTEVTASHGGMVYALTSGYGGSGSILKLSSSGELLARWGGGKLADPISIATDGGRVYVLYADPKRFSSAPAGSDSGRVEVLSPSGQILATWRLDQPRLQGVYPSRIAVDPRGSIYVSMLAVNDCPSLHEDCRQHYTLLRRYSPGGVLLARWQSAGPAVTYASSLAVGRGGIYLGAVGHIVKLSRAFRVLAVWQVNGCGPYGIGPVTGIATGRHGLVYATTSHGPDQYGTVQKLSAGGRVLATWGNCA